MWPIPIYPIDYNIVAVNNTDLCQTEEIVRLLHVAKAESFAPYMVMNIRELDKMK